MKKAPKPFDCEYSPQFAELLHKLGISLAISTYQAGKVVFLSAVDTDKLIQLPRTFENAMGMAVSKNKLAVSALNNVTVLRNDPDLAPAYPNNKGVYDGIYIPRIIYNTGYLALHDMDFIDEKLIAVNTLFSCLSYIDGKHSFTPFWQPPFISELTPDDRCHLNGMAIENNEIKYLTALGNTNTSQGWRENKMTGGILTDYPSGNIILNGLAMPHSPRIYDGKLYLLNSAQGELICVDPEKGTYEIVVQLGGFARGMDRYGDYLFIGVSKLRHNSKAFSDLEIAKTSFAGVIAVYLPYKSIVGSFKYEMSVDEIYDVKVIEGSVRPSILSADMKIHGQAVTTPHGSFWSNPEGDKTSVQTQNPGVQDQMKRSNEGQISYQIVKDATSKSLAAQFPALLFPLFLKKIQNEALAGKLIPLIALYKEKPVALTVTELRSDKTAELHSVFVSEEFRKKGIASEMLNLNDKLLKNNKIQYIDVSWLDAIHYVKVFEKLLEKGNWLKKQKKSLNVKLNVKKAVQAKWISDTLNMVDNKTEIIDWADITEADIDEIQLIEQQDGFPLYLTAFQLSEILDTRISKLMRINGKIAGWCIMHTIKPDTAQCSALYVKDEFRGKFESMKLIASSAQATHSKDIDYVIYQVHYQNQNLIHYLNSLIVTGAAEKNYHTLASRKYYTEVHGKTS